MVFANYFFSVLVLTIGLPNFFRTVDEIHNSKKLFDRELRSLLKRVFFIFWVFFIFFFSVSPLFCLVFLKMAHLFLALTKIFIKQRRRSTFREEFLIFLARIILEMKAGNSFKASINRSIEDSDAFLQQKFKLFSESVEIGRTSEVLKDHFVARMLAEFQEIEKSSHKILQKLESLRYQLEIENQFRRKSRSASLQVHIQSTLLVFMFAAILVFNISFFSWQKVKPYFLVSSLLFSLGTYFVFRKGGGYKWRS